MTGRKLHWLSIGRQIAFSGVFDPFTLLSAPPFRGLLVMPAAAKLTEEARFLYLLFEQTEGKIYVVMHHLDVHGITNGAAAVAVVRVVLPGSLSRFSPQNLSDGGQ
jgi:hypothetical protein